MRGWFARTEGAPLRKLQFMQSPETERPRQWVICSQGSDVTSKTDRWSLSARAPPPAGVRALKPPGSGTSTTTGSYLTCPEAQLSSLLAHGSFPAPGAAPVAPRLMGCPSSWGRKRMARPWCQGRSIAPSAPDLPGNLITNHRIGQGNSSQHRHYCIFWRVIYIYRKRSYSSPLSERKINTIWAKQIMPHFKHSIQKLKETGSKNDIVLCYHHKLSYVSKIL